MSYRGLGVRIPGYNPLTGAPLIPGQVVVTGPAHTVNPMTGEPRQTVVTAANPLSWPAWIEQDAAGNPVDRGTKPGGTWDGSSAQTLPDLVSTGRAAWWFWPLVGLGVYLLVSGKAGQRRSMW